MPSSRRPFGAAAVFEAWEPVCGRAGDERGRDVFCKNCPSPLVLSPTPKKLLFGSGRRSPSLSGCCWRSFVSGKGWRAEGMPVRPGSRGGVVLPWRENPERWQGEHVTVASVSQRCRKCRIFPSWFGRYISLRALLLLVGEGDDAVSVQRRGLAIPFREKVFGRGGGCKGEGMTFFPKGLPSPCGPCVFPGYLPLSF